MLRVTGKLSSPEKMMVIHGVFRVEDPQVHTEKENLAGSSYQAAMLGFILLYEVKLGLLAARSYFLQ